MSRWRCYSWRGMCSSLRKLPAPALVTSWENLHTTAAVIVYYYLAAQSFNMLWVTLGDVLLLSRIRTELRPTNEAYRTALVCLGCRFAEEWLAILGVKTLAKRCLMRKCLPMHFDGRWLSCVCLLSVRGGANGWRLIAVQPSATTPWACCHGSHYLFAWAGSVDFSVELAWHCTA